MRERDNSNGYWLSVCKLYNSFNVHIEPNVAFAAGPIRSGLCVYKIFYIHIKPADADFLFSKERQRF